MAFTSKETIFVYISTYDRHMPTLNKKSGGRYLCMKCICDCPIRKKSHHIVSYGYDKQFNSKTITVSVKFLYKNKYAYSVPFLANVSPLAAPLLLAQSLLSLYALLLRHLVFHLCPVLVQDGRLRFGAHGQHGAGGLVLGAEGLHII